MANSYTKAAFALTVTAGEANMLRLAERAVDILDTNGADEDLALRIHIGMWAYTQCSIVERFSGEDYDGIAAAVRDLFATEPDRDAVLAYAQPFSWAATTQGQLDLFHRILAARRSPELRHA